MLERLRKFTGSFAIPNGLARVADKIVMNKTIEFNETFAPGTANQAQELLT
jgi:hypothetical protein